jgi:hypothetical protein
MVTLLFKLVANAQYRELLATPFWSLPKYSTISARSDSVFIHVSPKETGPVLLQPGLLVPYFWFGRMPF